MQTAHEPISPREREVLAAVAGRATNAQIARRLGVSVRTVESHVSALLRKLGVGDRRDLAELAGDTGQPEPWAGLPVPRTSFVGRRDEVDGVLRLVAGGPVTTVAGPGGAGKTRLAVAAVERLAPGFPAGGAFVDLVPVQPGYVAEAVATTLRVTPPPGRSLLEAVAARLRGRALLVLDNCEHLVDEVAEVLDRLLALAPSVRVLATSRERLGIAGETVLHLGPLRTPEEAVALFTDRARAIAPEFTADPAELVSLCEDLGSAPLAIELAAARSASLGVDGLRAGTDDLLRLLSTGRGGNRRHNSLRAVLDWSYRLLDEEEQGVLRRIALFAGAFDLPAVLALHPEHGPGAVADLVGRLADKSLVSRLPGSPRWSLLTGVRQFAVERLRESTEEDEATSRYRGWVTERARALRARHEGWQDEFDALADDLRACVAAAPTCELAADVASLSFARGFLAEARRHYETASALAPAADALRSAAACAHLLSGAYDQYRLLASAPARVEDPAARADCLAAAAVVAERFRGAGFPPGFDPAEAAGLFATALSLVDDPERPEFVVARAWLSGVQSLDPGLAAAAEAAAAPTGDPVLLSAALDARCTAAALAGDPETALRLSLRRVELVGDLVAEPLVAVEVADAFRAVSTYAVATGAVTEALAASRRAQAHPLLAADPYWGHSGLVTALALAGALDEAEEAAGRLWAGIADAGFPSNATTAVPLLAAALAAGLRGEAENARRWRERAISISGIADPAGSPNLAPWDAFVRARIALHTGETDRRLLRAAGGDFAPGRFDGYAAAVAAELAVALDDPDTDTYLERATRHAERNRWTAASVLRARATRAGDAALLAQAAEAWRALGAGFESTAVRVTAPPERLRAE